MSNTNTTKPAAPADRQAELRDYLQPLHADAAMLAMTDDDFRALAPALLRERARQVLTMLPSELLVDIVDGNIDLGHALLP
ncbi:hypothetical protein [Cupriavidus sp. AcVe19-6a]|uniref:hypothetical protein n=1 Tax=Cupriavidus sp. AcVe19-6a TaxID=2821358 RepID=UPI001AE1D5CD|nr:hypothetical protein [Cupriavidus sp. AcVe19-6a]MBP0634901.1 hypothetical protein [Cupriavidus sp. AcVe19-6a]